MSNSDSGEREMTLSEWCCKLPDIHGVNVELRELRGRAASVPDICWNYGVNVERRELRDALKALQVTCDALSAENEKLDDALSCQMSLLDEYSYARTLDDRDIRAYLMKLYTKVSPRGAFNKKKALWKAEVLEEVAESLIAKHETSAHGLALILGAVEIRQQGENYREK